MYQVIFTKNDENNSQVHTCIILLHHVITFVVLATRYCKCCILTRLDSSGTSPLLYVFMTKSVISLKGIIFGGSFHHCWIKINTYSSINKYHDISYQTAVPRSCHLQKVVLHGRRFVRLMLYIMGFVLEKCYQWLEGQIQRLL